MNHKITWLLFVGLLVLVGGAYWHAHQMTSGESPSSRDGAEVR